MTEKINNLKHWDNFKNLFNTLQDELNDWSNEVRIIERDIDSRRYTHSIVPTSYPLPMWLRRLRPEMGDEIIWDDEHLTDIRTGATFYRPSANNVYAHLRSMARSPFYVVNDLFQYLDSLPGEFIEFLFKGPVITHKNNYTYWFYFLQYYLALWTYAEYSTNTDRKKYFLKLIDNYHISKTLRLQRGESPLNIRILEESFYPLLGIYNRT
jgi:hypothetical protein